MTPEDNKYKYTEITHEETNGNNPYVTKHVEEIVETTPSPTPYSNGYVHGQAVERSRQREELRERDEENKTNRWLVFGILIPTTAALLGGLLWSLNRLNEAQQTNTTPVIVPVPQKAQSPAPTRTTVIERIREVPVQQASPTTPNVNVIVPSPSNSAPTTNGSAGGTTNSTTNSPRTVSPNTSTGNAGTSTSGTSGRTTTPSSSSGNAPSYPSSSYTTTPSPQPTVDAPGANDTNNLPISPTNPSTNTTNSTNPTGPSNNPSNP
ncbi:MAG: hypothetical protein N5P05_001442 [Chroococcopsis gigantea SAG 12.99]|jgi:hypothetical protein|nr:hypothetical protein [Chlorogloea purpurea SAG 13.99]MDV2999836.1 hypothetical protein [Chroococcopsis gigantea SAG 12.99]